ncbi:MAG TPA: efflux transporter outer membrane subunit [Verrucomicrobiae bacterium]|nr:efflux transporter outer membrane subunit [Verrucomicrobiae bacterium]
MRTALASLALALAVILTGCAVGPNYRLPAALPGQPLPKTFTGTMTNGTVWKTAEPAANLPRGEWWHLFNDPELNRLEAQAATNNQNLAGAAAQFEQARQLAAEARANFVPQLTAGGTPNGDITRQRTSFNSPVFGHAAGQSSTYGTFTAPIYLGWELDLWGRVRRESEAARARFIASADDLESAKLALAAEIADDYFTLRALDNEDTLVAITIEAYRRSLALTENRRHGGIVSDLDVAQAATQLHSAEAQLPVIELDRAQLQHALATLCGQSAVDFVVPTNAVALTVVPTIPPGLPAELLERRPDVAAAERRMAAANAAVGVATAAFFPTVRFNGLAGLQSVDASTWFDWPSRFWAVGPSIELPLFTGGYNRAQLAATRAAYNETVANYRQTVLNAFGEVEDALAAQQLLAEEWEAENNALTSARHALEIANNRYRAGLVTYLDVATAQTVVLTHEQTVVQLEGSRLVTSINLIKAIGGGWQPPDSKRQMSEKK